jgi:hypothetical protein
MMTMAVTALMLTCVMVGVQGEGEANGNNKAPDLHVVALYNYTKVVTGDPIWYNLTIHNQGDGAFLVRHHGPLEIYAYRDDEAQVATFEKVYEDIYVNQTLVIDFQVVFDTVGDHSLTVLIDGADRVAESDEANNEATCSFTVTSAESNRPPKADGGNDRTGYTGKAVLFSAKYSTDPDHDILTYSWDFGDGTTGEGVRVYHVYEVLGDYAAKLTVSDGMYSDQDAFTVHIVEAPVNKVPTAIILASSKDVMVNDDVTLDGSSSMDLDGDELEFDWTIATGTGSDDRIRGDLITYSWDLPGHFKVTLVVSDGTDQSSTDVIIKVGSPPPPNEPPVAKAGADLSVRKGTEWTLRGVGYDTDGTIVSYEWDLDGDGVYDTYDETGGSIAHKFENTGYVTVKLRVTDDKGGTSVDSMVVTVTKKETDDKATPGFPAMVVVMAILGAALLARTGRIGGSWQRFQR